MCVGTNPGPAQCPAAGSEHRGCRKAQCWVLGVALVRVEDSSRAALSCAGAEGRGGNPTFELRSAGKSARHREVLGRRSSGTEFTWSYPSRAVNPL